MPAPTESPSPTPDPLFAQADPKGVAPVKSGPPIVTNQSDLYADLASSIEKGEVSTAPVEMGGKAPTGVEGEPVKTTPQGAPNAQEVPWSPSPLPEHMKPEDAYGAAKYFQSERDRAKQELERVQAQREGTERLAPVAEWLLENPDVYSRIRQEIVSGPTNGQAPVNPEPEAKAGQKDARALLQSLEKPSPPVKPANYNREEALYTPESDSAKYDESERAYQRSLIEYLSQRDELKDLVMQEAEQAREAERLKNEQVSRHEASKAQAMQALQYEHGFDREESQRFLTWVESGEAVNDMAAWVGAWKSVKAGQSVAPNPNALNPAEEARQAAATRYPRVAGAGGQSFTEQPRSLEQETSEVLDGMVSAFNGSKFTP